MNLNELNNALGIVKHALPNNEALPLLAHFCFDGERVTAYNGELAVSTPLQTDWTGLLHGKTLLKLLNNFVAKGDVVCTTKDNKIVFKAAGKQFSLPVLPVEDYPEIKAPARHKVELPVTSGLLGAVKLCQATADTNKQEIYSGVILHARDEGLFFYGTDKHAIGSVVIETLVEGDHLQVLSKPFCDLVWNLRHLSNGKLGITAKNATVAYDDGTQVIAALLPFEQDDIPDFEAILNQHIETTPLFQVPEGLDEGIKRGIAVSTTQAAHGITLALAEGALQLECKGTYGEVEETYDIAEDNTGEGSMRLEGPLLLRALENATHIGFAQGALVATNNDRQYVQVLATL